VMKAQTHVFHLRCFVCTVCCQQLQKGDQFVIKAGQLFCRADYEKELYMMQQASPRGQTRVEFLIINTDRLHIKNLNKNCGAQC
jgi:LIM domain